MNKLKHPVVAYGVALATVGAAVLLRQLLDPLMGDTLPLVTLFGAIPVAVWVGGIGPAVLVTVLGYLACSYLFIEPRGSIDLTTTTNVIGFIAYVFTSSIIIGFGQLLLIARRSAELAGERLHITIASVGDAVITTDAEGRVDSLNPVAVTLTGWTTAEAQGQPLETVFRIINEQSRQTVESPVEKVLRSGHVVGLANHTLLVAKDGTERAIDDSAAPIRDREGRTVGVVLVFHDVTERRQLERENEARMRAARFLAAIVESSEDAIISKTLTGTIQSWNAAAERLFGYKPAEVIGQPVTLLIPAERLPEEERIIASIARGERVNHFETIRIRKDGQRIPVSLTISPIRDDAGQIIGASKIVRDITERERLTQAEREARELLHATLVGIGDAVIATDVEGRVTFMNPVAVRLTGWAEAEAQTQPLTEVFRIVNETTRQPVDNPALRALKCGTIVGLANHTVLLGKDGVERPIDDSAAPIRSAAGQVSGAVLVFRDISERRKAEEAVRRSEERLRQAQEVAAIGTFDWNIATGVNTWTPELEAMYGLPRGAFAGTEPAWEDLIHPEDRAQAVELLRASLESGSLQAEWRVVWPDGSVHWLAGRGSVFRDESGKPVRLLGVNIDITDRKAVEEALRRTAAELSAADRQKNEFLATLAHELRNPLAPLSNGLQILRLSGDSPEAVQQTRTMMERQLTQMVRLVDDLLDLSRISRGTVELRPARVPLATIIQSALETSGPLIKAAGHELSIQLPSERILLDGDLTRLSQVFANLLNNAAKYTERGGHIWLAAAQQDGQVVVTIRDSGVGIPAEMLPRVFEMFTQIDRHLARSQGGLGIGLTLSKRLVELHGGTIEASSPGEGQGSTFTVRLPVQEITNTDPSQLKPESRAAKHGQRILIADDNVDAALSLAGMLRMLGHQVRTVHDGAEAVETAATFEPELILLDIGMPKLNGYEACRKIKELPAKHSRTFVALTGWGGEEDKRKSHEAGFDQHLTKPVDYSDLQKLLRGKESEG